MIDLTLQVTRYAKSLPKMPFEIFVQVYNSLRKAALTLPCLCSLSTTCWSYGKLFYCTHSMKGRYHLTQVFVTSDFLSFLITL